MEQKIEASREAHRITVGDCIVNALLLGTPLAAAGVIGHSVWVVARVMAHPVSPAMAIGLGIGAFFIALVCFFAFLKDATDFVVVPIMVILLTLAFTSGLVHARAKAQRHHHRPRLTSPVFQYNKNIITRRERLLPCSFHTPSAG